MAKPYFATGYMRLLYRYARTELAEAVLFEGTGCSESELLRAEFEMSFDAQLRMVSNAVTRAEPGLGLRVGDQLQLAAHGAVGTAMQAAPTLEAALDVFIELLPLRASFFSLARSVRGDESRLDLSVSAVPASVVPFFSESLLFSLMHDLTYFSGRRSNLWAIELGYPKPEYGAAYVERFGGPVTFGCEASRISFDRSLLELPSPEADAALFQDSLRRCRGQLEQRRAGTDLVNDIEAFLLANPGKLWTLDELAPLFAMSSRTMIRQLKQRGTSYQTLRDEVLKAQARRYLAVMGVEATALSLGFADTSSFRRSFKRWFGSTP